MTEWNVETALNHHAGCSVAEDGVCICLLLARREQIERSPLAPGEGTWSVFAQKVVAERDKAIEERNDVFRRLRDAERRMFSMEAERDAATYNPPVDGPTLYTRQQVEAMLRVALTDRTDEWMLKTVDERVAALLSMFTLPTTKEKP